MKKIVSLFCVIFVLLTTTFSASASISCEQVHYPMYFNGVLVPEGDKPILSLNWNTYVPLRKVCEGTGLTVDWNDKKQEIYVKNTAMIAAKDYANLSAIYKNTDAIDLYKILFSKAFSDALGCLTNGEYEEYESYLDLMDLYEGSIDTRIDASQMNISRLTGYYDGRVVTKSTYDNIENCLKHDLIISISCNNLGDAITKYANGTITISRLQAEVDFFLEDVEDASDLVDSPGAKGHAISCAAGQLDKYFLYSEFEAKKSNLIED